MVGAVEQFSPTGATCLGDELHGLLTLGTKPLSHRLRDLNLLVLVLLCNHARRQKQFSLGNEFGAVSTAVAKRQRGQVSQEEQRREGQRSQTQ